jgi:hypothetical protein
MKSAPRYFRSTPAVYASIGEQLDQAYGYPRPETLTDRTLPPVDRLPTDEQGRVYLAVSAAYCDYVLPGQLLPDLLAAGHVEELSAAEFYAIFPDSGDA